MLCISAVFDVMRWLCVCPSVTFVSCVKTNKDIFELFSPSGSHIILFFGFSRTKRGSDIQTGTNPPNGVSNGRGMKNDDFRPISRSISEMVIVRWAHAARQVSYWWAYWNIGNIPVISLRNYGGGLIILPPDNAVWLYALPYIYLSCVDSVAELNRTTQKNINHDCSCPLHHSICLPFSTLKR